MNYEENRNGTGYVFTRDNGEQIEFTPVEIGFVFHEMERCYWRGNIENAIERCIEQFDFDKMDEDEFVQCCLDELESKWENDMLDDDPDFDEVVFEIAQDNGIWRND